MKAFLIFFLSLVSTTAESPTVGFLKLYNGLDYVITPSIGENALAPLRPNQEASVQMLPTTPHTLTFQSDRDTPEALIISMKANQNLTLCLLHPTHSNKPKTFLLPEPPLSKIPLLHIQSLCDHPLTLQFQEQELNLHPGQVTVASSWTARDFQLKIMGDFVTSYEVEDAITHTLLIWENSTKSYQTALFPRRLYTAPRNLRKDLSFGRKREEIKGLKTLLPNQ